MGVVGGPHSKGNGSRGRPYALMLLLAFGAALAAVMLLHKFRERRICNLLLQQRDQDLLSLQLLFQKQRDRNKELEKNNEDMKAKLYSLRSQKMELDRRLLEMQSTIDSLRDEQKTIDVALQEKQNEIKMLREKENSRVVALTESLKQKEAELEDSRHRLQSSVKVQSVATDDPSNPEERNDQLLKSRTKSFKVGENESMDNNRRERNSADFSEGRTSTRGEIGTHRSAEEDTEKGLTTGKQRQKQEILEDQDENREGMDGEMRRVDGKESEIIKNHEKEVKDSQQVENQEPDGVLKIGKMETETVKYGHTNKFKGKRWRYIARKRRSDDQWRLIRKNYKLENYRNLDGSGAKRMSNRKFIEGGTSKEEKMEATNSLDSSGKNLQKRHQETIAEDERENEMEKEGRMSKHKEFDSTESNVLSEDGEQRQDERHLGKREAEDGGINRNTGEQMEPIALKTEEKQERERDAEGRAVGESSSDVKGEYKEETDESEY